MIVWLGLVCHAKILSIITEINMHVSGRPSIIIVIVIVVRSTPAIVDDSA
jgi:hypothetical protein